MKEIQDNLKIPHEILIKNIIMSRDVINEIWCDDDNTL